MRPVRAEDDDALGHKQGTNSHAVRPVDCGLRAGLGRSGQAGGDEFVVVLLRRWGQVISGIRVAFQHGCIGESVSEGFYSYHTTNELI